MVVDIVSFNDMSMYVKIITPELINDLMWGFTRIIDHDGFIRYLTLTTDEMDIFRHARRAGYLTYPGGRSEPLSEIWALYCVATNWPFVQVRHKKKTASLVVNLRVTDEWALPKDVLSCFPYDSFKSKYLMILKRVPLKKAPAVATQLVSGVLTHRKPIVAEIQWDRLA